VRPRAAVHPTETPCLGTHTPPTGFRPGFPHPWGATSCNPKAASLSYLLTGVLDVSSSRDRVLDDATALPSSHTQRTVSHRSRSGSSGEPTTSPHPSTSHLAAHQYHGGSEEDIFGLELGGIEKASHTSGRYAHGTTYAHVYGHVHDQTAVYEDATSPVWQSSPGNGAALAGGGGEATGEHPLGEHPSRTLFVRNINRCVCVYACTSSARKHSPRRRLRLSLGVEGPALKDLGLQHNAGYRLIRACPVFSCLGRSQARSCPPTCAASERDPPRREQGYRALLHG